MATKNLKELIEEQFNSGIELPVFNPVALQLQRLREDENLTASQVTEIIMSDQALASRVLVAANSAFFAGLSQVDTVTGAVVRLGINQICNLAMVAAQAAEYVALIPKVAAEMPKLWARSYAGAAGARWLAAQCGMHAQLEAAFLAGLLHDIGELFLLKMIDQLCASKRYDFEISEALMREILHAMHTDVGYRLMTHWGLPEVYARIARDHHLPDCDESDSLLAIIRLVDIACSRLGIGQEAHPAMFTAASAEAQLLGLKDIKLAELEILLEDKMAEAGAMLK